MEISNAKIQMALNEHESLKWSSNAVCRPPSSVLIITNTRVEVKVQRWESQENGKNEL